VLLLCVQSLLGESLENVLSQVEDVELMGPWVLDGKTLARLSQQMPDIVLIAEEDEACESVAAFTTQILDQYPDLPVVRIGWEQNVIRLYTSHMLPARRAELIEIIRSLPAHQPGS
jgi:hypothetical protein